MKIWEVVFLLPFFAGLYMFVKTPLSQRYGGPGWSDPVAGFTMTMITALYFYFAHFSAQILPEGNSEPCGSSSKQMECYNLSPEICMSAWESSSGGCLEQVEQIRKSRPSFLSGAFLYKCIGRNFDKMMHYNRKKESSASCQSYFMKIDKRD